jgi:hypothetical protein
VDAKRKIVAWRLLLADVEDLQLRVGHTATEPGLGVGLVLDGTVATGRAYKRISA